MAYNFTSLLLELSRKRYYIDCEYNVHNLIEELPDGGKIRKSFHVEIAGHTKLNAYIINDNGTFKQSTVASFTRDKDRLEHIYLPTGDNLVNLVSRKAYDKCSGKEVAFDDILLNSLDSILNVPPTKPSCLPLSVDCATKLCVKDLTENWFREIELLQHLLVDNMHLAGRKSSMTSRSDTTQSRQLL